MSSFDSFLLFTDAADEKCEGGLGGVLLDSSGHVLSWFSRELSKEECDEQVITELESLAVLVSLRLWARQLRFKHVVCFLDNEGARGAILKARSPNKFLRKAASLIASLEEALGCFVWYSRVPSKSNIADSPSRAKRTGSCPKSSKSKLQGTSACPQPLKEGRLGAAIT